MFKCSRLAAVVLIVSACLCLPACGSASDGAVAVEIGASSISRATVEHWVRIEAVTSHEANPTRPAPKGLIPTPPDYTDCVAYMLKEANGRPAPTRAQLKRECATKYRLLEHQILELLITYYWISGEGARIGVSVTQAEIARYLAKQFPTNAELQRFRKITGQSAADQRMLATRVLLSIKLQKRLAERAHISIEQAIARFATELAARWAPRTSCRPGYVVPQCRQYRGSHL